MLSWPALLLAPLIALGQLSIAYALVGPACARRDPVALHVVSIVALALVVVLTLLAWRGWQRVAQAKTTVDAAAVPAGPVTLADGSGASQRPRFVALVAVLVGALSALVCAALWLPIWVLSPCS